MYQKFDDDGHEISTINIDNILPKKKEQYGIWAMCGCYTVEGWLLSPTARTLTFDTEASALRYIQDHLSDTESRLMHHIHDSKPFYCANYQVIVKLIC